jgi:carbamoyl-phosphate synthase large subunit
MREDFNVLISSAGRRVALLKAFRQSLGELDLQASVQAADMSPLSAAMQIADARHLVPACTTAEFIPHLLDICRENSIRLLVPTIDTELKAYSEACEEFAAVGTSVAISSPETIAICADKQRTHEWLVNNNFPTVRQASVDEILRDLEHWRFPLIAKPVAGSASAGIRFVRSARELRGLDGERDYVIQEVASGAEFTLDVLVDREGSARCSVPRLRLEVRAGEVSKGVTVRHANLEQLGSTICEELPGAYGVLTVQIFLDETTGTMNVIEINPRFGGGYPLAFQAGANYPRWMVEEMLGMTSTVSKDGWEDGLVMLRYDDAAFIRADEVGLQ